VKREVDPNALRLPLGKIACQAPGCTEAAKVITWVHATNTKLRLCSEHHHMALDELKL
jgi:hypothetical protein